MDHYSNTLLQKLNQFMQRIQLQEQCIQNLEQKISMLQTEIEELKARPYTKIDNIEYKFDQLKVEKLNGTLNIGLNPFSGEAVEDFSVTGDKIQVNGEKKGEQMKEYEPMPHLQEQRQIQLMQQKAEQFLYTEGKKIIEQIAKNLDVEVSNEVMNYILDDIRRQLPARIHFQQSIILQNQTKPLTPEELNAKTLQAFKTDIQKAVEVFLLHLPRQMGEEKS